jgi:hypothetical protein
MMSEQLSYVVAEIRAGRDPHLTAEDAETLWGEVFEVEIASSHDPLCPYIPSGLECNKDHECSSGVIVMGTGVKCQCELISKVREEYEG